MPNLDDDNELQSQDSGDSSIKDIIAQRLQEGSDALKGAQDVSNKNRLAAGLAEGLGQMAAGRTQFNPAGYKFLQDSASAPVENLLQQQKARGVNLSQLGEEQGIQDKGAAQDPNSARSKMIQTIFKKYNPQLGGIPVTAEDSGLLAKLQENKETSDTRKVIAEQNNLIKKDFRDQKLEEDFSKDVKGNKSWSQADTTANTADGLMDTVRNAVTNKTSAASLPTELANFASRGQRLHGATIDAFQNPNSDIMTRITSALTKGKSGTIPPDVAQDIAKYLQLEKQAAQVQKEQVLKQRAEDFKSKNGRYPKTYDPFAQSSASVAPASSPFTSSAWTPAHESRLQELLKKQQEGTLDASK